MIVFLDDRQAVVGIRSDATQKRRSPAVTMQERMADQILPRQRTLNEILEDPVTMDIIP